jgi:hypothetical protein
MRQHTRPEPMSKIDHETKLPQEITSLPSSDPYQLLGVRMALDGNTRRQLNSLQTDCNKLAISFTGCHLTHQDTIQGYLSIYLPAVKYGLEATSIPETLLRNFQGPVTRGVLPKLGYNLHMPLPVVYATSYHGSVGLQDLSTEQGLLHALFLLGHLRATQTQQKASQYSLRHTC